MRWHEALALILALHPAYAASEVTIEGNYISGKVISVEPDSTFILKLGSSDTNVRVREWALSIEPEDLVILVYDREMYCKVLYSKSNTTTANCRLLFPLDVTLNMVGRTNLSVLAVKFGVATVVCSANDLEHYASLDSYFAYLHEKFPGLYPTQRRSCG